MHSSVKPREAGVTARSRASMERRPTARDTTESADPTRPAQAAHYAHYARHSQPDTPHPGPPAWPPGHSTFTKDPLSGCQWGSSRLTLPNRTNHFRPLRQDELLAYHTETSMETARRRRQ